MATRSISRRRFLHTAATSAAALSLSRWTAQSRAQVSGANNRVRVAVIGCNDCGRSHIRNFAALKDVELIGLCDVDSAVLDQAQHMAPAAVTYADFRRVLDRTDIDAVSIATPNHWHALLTILACQAGKDVYVEKPTCHNIWEGQQAIAARAKYDRIVQAGTQWRSMPQVQQAMQFAKSGQLGKILVSRGFCYKRRPSIGKTTGPQPIPATVDYDLWCGPAPLDPPRRTKFHYDWHWFWQTGNGDIGNQGAHQMDLARWALDKPAVAPSVLSFGGRFGYTDDGQTPNTLVAVHDYGDSLLIFEVRGLPTRSGANQMDQYRGVDVGNCIECENGYVTITTRLCAAYDSSGKQIQRFAAGGVSPEQQHKENFIQAVRTRKRQDQACELAEGHASSSLALLSNISYLLGTQAEPDAVKDKLKGPAADSFDRFSAHLEANGIQLDVDKACLGMPLTIDPATQKIQNNPAADELWTRTYREPFVVRPQV
jgi:predicted dehydrogenase